MNGETRVRVSERDVESPDRRILHGESARGLVWVLLMDVIGQLIIWRKREQRMRFARPVFLFLDQSDLLCLS